MFLSSFLVSITSIHKKEKNSEFGSRISFLSSQKLQPKEISRAIELVFDLVQSSAFHWKKNMKEKFKGDPMT